MNEDESDSPFWMVLRTFKVTFSTTILKMLWQQVSDIYF